MCLLALAAAGLSACGGSSTPQPTATATVRRDLALTVPGKVSLHDPALRRCLAAHGVVPAAQGGVHGARYQAALRSCLPAPSRVCPSGCTPASAPPKARGRLGTPGYRSALEAFAECVRRHGVPLPPPNTTGRGPVFSARGVDIHSGRFRPAIAGCRGLLPRAAHG
jgi:hypothetical protein